MAPSLPRIVHDWPVVKSHSSRCGRMGPMANQPEDITCETCLALRRQATERGQCLECGAMKGQLHYEGYTCGPQDGPRRPWPPVESSPQVDE